LLQGRGELLVVIGPELGGHVLGPQVDDEAFLGPREGAQQAPVKAGVRDAQVRERLRLALAACRLRGSANHDYIVPHATDNIGATRARGGLPEPIPKIKIRHRTQGPVARLPRSAYVRFVGG
jgi:hypothetical protein